MAACPSWTQAEGLLQAGAGMAPIFGGLSSNLVIAERGNRPKSVSVGC